MKSYTLLMGFFLATSLIFCGAPASGQKNIASPWNPSLDSVSDKWKLTTRQKMFGNISKLEFGPFSIVSIEKLDSPVIKKKIKGGADFGLQLGYDARMETGKGVSMDITRKIAYEKTKYYRMLLAGNIDTAETMYSLLSISNEEKETTGGALIKLFTKGHYGSDVNSSRAIGYQEFIKGYILSDADSVPWDFFFTLSKGNNNTSPGSFSKDNIQSSNSFTGYLKYRDDSLYIAPGLSMSVVKVFGKYDTIYFDRGFELINQAGEHLAAYQENGENKMNAVPYIWMRKDLENSYRQAISSFLAVIISRKHFQDMKSMK